MSRLRHAASALALLTGLAIVLVPPATTGAELRPATGTPAITPQAPGAARDGSAPSWLLHPKVEVSLRLAVLLALDEGPLPSPSAVIAEFTRPLDEALAQTLRDAGAHVVRSPSGAILHVGRFAGLRLMPGAMPRLLALEVVRRVDAPAPLFPRRLGPAADAAFAHEVMAGRLGYERVARTLGPDGEPIRGDGMTAAVVDFNLDPFHPALFHADGGVHPWVDTDGDGRLTPGVDGVDLDGDGSIGDGEILQLAEFPVVVPRRGGADTTADEAFTPRMDYLYLDSDGDGQRGVGRDVAAHAYTPGLSEPTFVGDDVDRDGALDPAERLVRLGTPKVKIVYHLGTDQVFTPGPTFDDYVDGIRAAGDGQDIEYHGTYVATRVAGGTSAVEHLGGVAPGADVVFIDIENNNALTRGDLVTGIAWLKEHGGQAFNYAFGEVISRHADGSSILEQAMTELHHEGFLQSASAGNEANGRTHAIVPLRARETFELGVDVGFRSFVPDAVFVTLRWRGSDRLRLDSVRLPDGSSFDASPVDRPLGGTVTAGDRELQMTVFGGRSARDTVLTGRAISAANGQRLLQGEWTFVLVNNGSAPIEVDVWTSNPAPVPLATVADEELLDARQTVTYPATADDIFTVGACSAIYAGQSFATGPQDCPLAPYSSVGPRIDGVRQVALVAPTDMLAGYPLLRFSGGLLQFGGTSGASPHATGTALLLLQAAGGASVAALHARMLDGLRRDRALGTLPNIAWGEGILDSWAAVFPDGGEAAAHPVASLQVRAEGDAAPGASVDLSFVVDSAGTPLDLPGLVARVDVGYDGQWDVPAGPSPLTVHLPDEAVGALPLRVEAFDGAGASWHAVATLELGGGGEPPMDAGADGVGSADAAGSADATSADTSGGPDALGGGGSGGAGGCGGGQQGLWFAALSLLGRRRRRES